MHLLRRFIPLVFAFAALAAPAASSAQISVGLSITLAPPALPVYVQPALPAPGYIWTPGYWSYGPDGYYWVPGTWVEPPAVGLLWTPGYWGWAGGIYAWHAGYWGPHVGFYGGINYGFGYTGVGFAGGLWDHGVFTYNRAVNNVTITNVTVFNRAVVVPPGAGRVSFNGGTGGTRAQPTPGELAAARERHVAATPLQAQHEHAAAGNRALLASVNHNRPPIAATSRPGEFQGAGVVAARPAGARQPPSGAPARTAVRPAGEAARPAEQRGRPAERNERPEERGEHPERQQ
jgi:hypothetical protein